MVRIPGTGGSSFARMNRLLPCMRILLLVGSIALLCSCSARAMRTGYQPPVAGGLAQRGPVLLVPSFRFKATGIDASNNDKQRLENSLRQTLSNTGLYRTIAQTSDPATSAETDTLSVELVANLEKK